MVFMYIIIPHKKTTPKRGFFVVIQT